MHPFVAQPAVGLGEDEQVVLERGRYRVRGVHAPPAGDLGDVLAATVEHDDGGDGGLRRGGGDLDVTRAVGRA